MFRAHSAHHQERQIVSIGVGVVATFVDPVVFPEQCFALPVCPNGLIPFHINLVIHNGFFCAASRLGSSLFYSTQASLPNFKTALAIILWLLSFVYLVTLISKTKKKYHTSDFSFINGPIVFNNSNSKINFRLAG